MFFSGVFRALKVGGRVAPERVVAVGYALYVLLGTAALLLPWSQRTGVKAGWLDHLFTATSALSTTGLSTVSTSGAYSFSGQLVILVLIQAGGLGYMTFGSYIALAVSGKISPFRRDIASAVLATPHGFDLKHFLKSIVFFTVVIELVGTVALYPVFRSHGWPLPWWQAVFHSVSAFCTAGFSLADNSFESLRGERWLNLVIIVLSYLGAVGFIVIGDWWEWATGRKKGMTLTSKIILLCTVTISVVGTILFAMDEPSVVGLSCVDRVMISWFQVMTASTTVGFNTIPIGALSGSSLFLLTVVMVIGASPSGTGGGLKTTSVTALWAVMTAVVRRDHEIKFAGRLIPMARVHAAVANMMFYLLTLGVGIYVLALVDKHVLTEQMFECASALGTVGLSCGITATLSSAGKVVIILLMYLGRVGPLALGMALFIPRRNKCRPVTEDVAI